MCISSQIFHRNSKLPYCTAVMTNPLEWVKGVSSQPLIFLWKSAAFHVLGRAALFGLEVLGCLDGVSNRQYVKGSDSKYLTHAHTHTCVHTHRYAGCWEIHSAGSQGPESWRLYLKAWVLKYFGSHIWVESIVMREGASLSYFSVVATKIPEKSKLSKGLFWHLVQGTVHRGGESSSQQELKAAGNTASTVRKKKAMDALIWNTFSFLCSPGCNPREWCCPLLYNGSYHLN